MDEPYASREFPLGSDQRTAVKQLMQGVDQRLNEVAEVVSQAVDVPLLPDRQVTRFELKTFAEAADSGVYIIELPTDPPLLACAYYSGGEYTSVVYPCTEIVLPGGGTIDLGGPF
jgi:hypothetical protein